MPLILVEKIRVTIQSKFNTKFKKERTMKKKILIVSFSQRLLNTKHASIK